MGPLLVWSLLELSELQEGVSYNAFRVADEQGMPLLELKDLQALLVWLGEQREELTLRYGNVSATFIVAIRRRFRVFKNQSGAERFGEPVLALSDIISTTADGRGRINILASEKLMGPPRLYAKFVLWLLSELLKNHQKLVILDKPSLSSSLTNCICCLIARQNLWLIRSSKLHV